MVEAPQRRQANPAPLRLLRSIHPQIRDMIDNAPQPDELLATAA
ncbi:hypothetical protein [Streptomyces sp. WAC 06738]|nr:hypothetical protein [Streptomyces sp. WAC 06738]